MSKILFLPRWYPAESDRQNGVFIRKHAQAAALHHEVTVLYAEPTTGETKMELAETGNLTEVIVYYKSSFLKPVSILLYCAAILRGWKFIRQSGFQPDICHVHVLNRPALLALWLKWRKGIPFLISEHWSGYITGKFEQRGLLSGLFTAFAIKQAKMVSVVSETLKAGMEKCGLHADYRIVPNVVEVLPDAWKQQPPTDVFRFLVVADLRDEIKNISGIIRAFAAVYQADKQIELVIAGEGPDKEKFEALAQMVEAPVHFKGRLINEEVLKLIPSAHVVLVNSNIETFSVLTLEAIFSGCPVIASRCGGPEKFINERNGILIDKNNEQQLADAMRKVKLNYSSYQPEIVKNSVPGSENYSLQGVANTLEKCYEEVASIK